MRKKALAELRDLKKPVGFDDVLDHAGKYDKLKANNM